MSLLAVSGCTYGERFCVRLGSSGSNRCGHVPLRYIGRGSEPEPETSLPARGTEKRVSDAGGGSIGHALVA